MTSAGQSGWIPYCGAAPLPDEWLTRWNFDPLLLLGLGALFLLLRKASPNGARRQYRVAALALAVLLFVSPFCALASALFSARVAHHGLLSGVLAPLLVFALPVSRTRWPGSLAGWTALQAIAFWMWHAPNVYAEALSTDLVYWAMQASLLGTSAGFWAVLKRSGEPAAIAALLATTVQMGLLGALITFAGAPLYAPHFLTTEPWGLTPLEDQQLAGLVMWVPAAALYLGAAILVARRLLAQEEKQVPS
jgi:putative membrane protein